MDKTLPTVETTSVNLEDRIRTAAHQMWEAEGRPEGLAETHWLHACELIAKQDEAFPPEWLQRDAERALKAEKPEPTTSIEQIKKRLENRAA